MRKNEATQITGTYVILVPYKEKHVLKYHEWMKSIELQHLTGSDPLTLEEEYQMQKRWHQDEDKCTFIILDKEVFLKTGDEIEAMIGDTNLFFNDPEDSHTAETEIMIADATSRGKGRGKEATILMLVYGADVLNVRKYQVKIKLENEKSITMFRKLGFLEVGTSEIFQEITLEKYVEQSWIKQLRERMPEKMSYEVYNEQ